jgi:branched-chain amino acid transport system substrate-binding protein
MKGTGHWRALLALVLAFGLVAAACGDSDDDEGGADTTTAPETTAGAETTAAPDTTAAGETTAAPETTAGGTTAGGGAATGEPIKIGILSSLTGNFAPWGLQVRDGMRLAIEEINAAGGVDGRPLELVEGDDQSDAEEGAPAFERLVEEGVVAIGGVISSDVGLATSLLAEELQTPLFLVKAGASTILTPESRHVFRTCLPSAPMVADPIAQYVQQEGLTKVGAIIADYGWGHSIEEAMQTAIGGLEGVELQIEVAPVPEQDFTTYLRNLEGLAPELIVATGHPPGSGPITVQSADLGIDVPVTGAWSVLSLVMEGAGDAAIGKYSDFDCADYQSEEYQDLARRYLALSDNTFMDDDAVAGFGIVTMLADAVANAGDDPAAIAEYLHGQTYDLPGYAFEMGWTEWGELATAQPIFSVISEGPAPEGVNEGGTWYPQTLAQSEPLEPFMP